MAKRRFMTVTVMVVAIATAALAGCGSSSKSPPASPHGGATSPTSAPVTSSNGGRDYGY
jgi:uncharacterized lipoprotein YajG